VATASDFEAASYRSFLVVVGFELILTGSWLLVFVLVLDSTSLGTLQDHGCTHFSFRH
jgi:hypothetical protein